MDAPKYQQPPDDPAVAALKQSADLADTRALQNKASIDTASIMARFGTAKMMAGTPPPVAAI